MMKISIVIPAYNEEKRIGKTLNAYSRYFNSIIKEKDLDYEILVVINNTTDRTKGIVKKIQNKNKKIRYLDLKQGGKGYAIIEGFKDSLRRKNDLIGFVDSDMSTLPEEYARLALDIGEYDGIIASRYLPGAIVKPKPTTQRMVSSRIYNLWIRFLFLMPYHDTQCGAKVFKREAVAKVVNKLIITKWAFDVDLLYNLRKYGFKIKETPTRWSDAAYSKINFLKAGPIMALSMLRLRLLNSPLKGLIKLYGVLPDWMKIHNKLA